MEWSGHPSLVTDDPIEKVNAKIPENRQFTIYELHIVWPAIVWVLTKRQKMLCRAGWKACYSGILSLHYICFNIAFYMVLNFVIFSCSENRTGFILIGLPVVSVFLNGPIILSDMAYLKPYIFITLTQDGSVSVTHIISST